MAAEEIIWPVCGAKNSGSIQRCRSCGARVDAATLELSDEEELERRHQQDTFEWKWVFVAFSVYAVLQGVVLVGLYYAIPAYDPQGLWGIAISAAVWFVGGVIVGTLSPGKTFIEPPVGAALSAVPTIMWLSYISDVRELSPLAYIVGGLLGVMVTLFGAFLGEKIQMGTRGHVKT